VKQTALDIRLCFDLGPAEKWPTRRRIRRRACKDVRKARDARPGRFFSHDSRELGRENRRAPCGPMACTLVQIFGAAYTPKGRRPGADSSLGYLPMTCLVVAAAFCWSGCFSGSAMGDGKKDVKTSRCYPPSPQRCFSLLLHLRSARAICETKMAARSGSDQRRSNLVPSIR